MQMEKEVTAVEAARKLGVGLDYLYSLIWTGKVPGRKDGNRWRVSLAAIEARLKERESRNAR
jgi:excisionase family DNA binding protein